MIVTLKLPDGQPIAAVDLERGYIIRIVRDLTQEEKDERWSPPLEVIILDEDMSL